MARHQFKRVNSLKPKIETNLRPKTDEEIEQDQRKDVVENPPDSQHITTETNLDSYLKVAEKEDNLSVMEKDAEISDLKNQVEMLRNEKNNLLDKISKLLEEIESLKKPESSVDTSVFKEEILSLRRQRDNLMMRNSELELEVLKNIEIAKNTQKSIDTNLHTYTHPGYSGKSGYATLKNGYSDWL